MSPQDSKLNIYINTNDRKQEKTSRSNSNERADQIKNTESSTTTKRPQTQSHASSEYGEKNDSISSEYHRIKLQSKFNEKLQK